MLTWRIWLRRIGVAVALTCMLIGWMVHPWLLFAGAGLWLVMIITSGGCPLGMCALPKTPAPPAKDSSSPA